MLLHAIKLFSRSIFAFGSFEKYLLTTRSRVAKVTHHSVRGEVACVRDDALMCQRVIHSSTFFTRTKGFENIIRYAHTEALQIFTAP